VPVFRRDDLGVGATVSGPAIVEERETTSVIRPGWVMEVAADGSLIATSRGAREAPATSASRAARSAATQSEAM
jgi:N-methylhydantoinase A